MPGRGAQAVPWPCPAPSRCLPAPRSISSLRRLRSCLTPFRGHPLISSVPLGPACRHEALLAALSGGSGRPAPREGSQRHLRLTRPSPRARGGEWNRHLMGARSHGYPPRPDNRGCLQAALPAAQNGCCLPPHQKQQNTHGERVPPPTRRPSAIQSRLRQAERVREAAGHNTAQGNWPAAAGGQHFGKSPSASIP